MRAREYADMVFRNEGNDPVKLIGKIAIMMLAEVADNKRIKTDIAMFSALDQTCQKWQAFVRIVGISIIRPDGIEEFIKAKMPEIYIRWKDYKKQCLAKRKSGG